MHYNLIYITNESMQKEFRHNMQLTSVACRSIEALLAVSFVLLTLSLNA